MGGVLTLHVAGLLQSSTSCLCGEAAIVTDRGSEAGSQERGPYLRGAGAGPTTPDKSLSLSRPQIPCQTKVPSSSRACFQVCWLWSLSA